MPAANLTIPCNHNPYHINAGSANLTIPPQGLVPIITKYLNEEEVVGATLLGRLYESLILGPSPNPNSQDKL